MSRRTYAVIDNTPGCLPESEPLTFTRRCDAEGCAAARAREYRENGFRVRGNAREGYFAWASEWDLGRVIEIVEVSE